MTSPNYRYVIDPRPAQLGGGWRLRLMENEQEVGGGIFPLAEYANEREPEKAAFSVANTANSIKIDNLSYVKYRKPAPLYCHYCAISR